IAKSDLVAEINEGGCDGSRDRRRRLADPGSGVSTDAAPFAGAAGASARVSPAARPRPGRDERKPARTAHADAVERAQSDMDLLVLVGVSALPRVGRGGRVSRALAAGTFRLRRQARDRVGVAGDGRRARQGAAWRRGYRPPSDRQSKKRGKRSLLTEGKGIPLRIAPAGAQ